MTRAVPKKWIRNPSDELAVKEGCTFDADAGQTVCDFIERFCCNSRGSQWAGEPIKLIPWQRDFLMRLFGWRKSDDRRRFRSAYIEVAKKNGKTTLLAALELYLLLCDDDGPDIYINACDRDQAGMMYEESKRMVEASPVLAKSLRVVDYRKRIVFEKGNGVIRANSADAPNKDGLNPSAVIWDELHRQPDRKLWEVFRYASAARREPLRLAITTAGESEDGVWFEQRQDSEKINRGEVPDTSHLGIVYRAEATDDLDDPATWRKANPSMGITITEEDFKRELEEAKRNPLEWHNFIRLRLNIVARESGLFITPEQWKACDEPLTPLTQLSGDPCYGGGDLSTVNDMTAAVFLFGDPESGYDVHCRFYLPEADILDLERKHRVPYRLWAEQGHLELTPGNSIDYEFVRRDINKIADNHDLKQFLCDPFNATDLLIRLTEHDGLPVEAIRQGFLSLNAPTKELQRLVLSRKIRHGNNPILKWMIGNAVAEQDAAGSLKLSKDKSRKKIDGVSALVNAIAAASSQVGEVDSVYEKRVVLFA